MQLNTLYRLPPGCARHKPGKLLLLPLLLPFLLLLSPPLAAQRWNANQVLDSLRTRFNRIEDYQVDIQVSLDMPMLRMPRKKMTFTFKQPDKTSLEARGFAMVPRRGLVLSPDSLFKNLHDLTLIGDTLLNRDPCLILRGLEEGPDDMTLRADVIVDRKLWLVRIITTYLENNEAFRLQTEYVEAAPGIYMPTETHLRFQLNESFIQGGRRDQRSYDPDIQEPVFDNNGDLIGEAAIIFTNYRVNQGIPDNFFQDGK
ncbi:MAG: hypothetical protein JSU77_13895 [Fidelibacterota bacterium]|nr:MAG: hypothetical protein JSU77_13895 [Candidatus Neomarinimicrobiota bacterium]